MRIKNTSRYPTDEVEQLVRFASRGIDSSRVEVHVKNSKRVFAGRAWHNIGRNMVINVAEDITDLLVVRVGSPTNFPFEFSYPRLKTAPRYMIQDWREAVVCLTAHELYHIKQRRTGRRASEVRAERWALKRLLEYRRAIAQTISS
ncbi:hypothetical protein KEJ39_01160 [Candidatus Bathyarchaeota archaeon]|nr:hypothetical protein [Candidatus Bathyarchaeota archaeon]